MGKKTELIVFSKQIKFDKIQNFEIESYEEKRFVKHVVDINDQTLNFQQEIKSTVNKRYLLIKHYYPSSKTVAINYQINYNESVCHEMTTPWNNNFTPWSNKNIKFHLKKRLSWFVKTCFNRPKYDSS